MVSNHLESLSRFTQKFFSYFLSIELTIFGIKFIYGLTYNKHTLESLVLSSNIDEPFEWQILADNNGNEPNVYFKSQNPFTYTDAKEYCSKGSQGGLKATEVGTHSSQLWMFNQTNGVMGTLINKGSIWKSPEKVTWKMEEKENKMVVLSGAYKNFK